MNQAAADLPEVSDAGNLITYEQPLTERMRTFLRLEFLFRQAIHHASGESTWESRAAVASLLDVLTILGRGDIRTDVLQELERRAGTLARYRSTPGVDSTRLDHVLEDIGELRAQLDSSRSLTQSLKECEFLSSVKHRSSIPGGTCAFDLPDYNHWLNREPEQRQQDFGRWLVSLRPLQNAVSQLLWLMRESGTTQLLTANGGMYQNVLDRGVSCQLLRISLPAHSELFPEISGNQHRFTVRFQTWRDIDSRPAQTGDDVEFYLSCC